MNRRTLAVHAAALIAGVLGLIVSIRINGPGPLLGTAAGRWLAEQVGGDRSSSGVQPSRPGEAIGPLELTDLDGHPQQLPATRGHRRVLINVWASWCVPCREEMPILTKFAADQGPNGVQVVGIAQDDPAAVRAYLRLIPVNYPILLDDPAGHAGIRLGDRLDLLPYSVLLDADGRLLRRNYGPFATEAVLTTWATQPE
jgi:thiol-disulfide isomerase/thioredoxin